MTDVRPTETAGPDISTLDAHEQPSEYLRAKWKAYAKAPAEAIEASGDIDEVTDAPETTDTTDTGFVRTGTLPADRVAATFAAFLAAQSPVDGDVEHETETDVETDTDYAVFHHPLLPGLLVIPGLVPPTVQRRLLDRMVHRDLVQPHHQTNMHLHYDVPYPDDGASFFSYAPPTNAHGADVHAPGTFVPKDATVHRPLSIQQVLDRRLHWVTLGGQYDWTNRVYPGGDRKDDTNDNDGTPRFPSDLTDLLAGLFPATVAQAAIVNFYTPGDTMMIHRDVSEETDKGLISLSLGCDALFMAAPTGEFQASNSPKSTDGKEPYVLLRIRSGDAVYMSGHDRFAWHGVPKVIKGTCPAFLADWPAGEHSDGRFEAWRGWMRNKRVNFNVRQMRD